MHLCIFVACKNEEINVELAKFVAVLPEDMREAERQFIRDKELELIQQLKFHLVVHSAFRPLKGFCADLSSRFGERGLDVPKLREHAERLLRQYLLSDVGFLFPPSQIALSALVHAGAAGDMDLGFYLEGLCDGKESLGSTSKLKEQLGALHEIGTSAHQLARDEAKVRFE